MKFSRRNFLKTGGAATAVTALASGCKGLPIFSGGSHMTSSINLSIPFPLIPPKAGDWEQYRTLLKEMRASRAILFAPLDTIIQQTLQQNRAQLAGVRSDSDAPDLAYYKIWAEMLRDRVAFFRNEEIETAFWLGHSIGHGGALSGSLANLFQPLVGPSGENIPGCFCPMDERFRTYAAQAMALIAGSGVPLIILDDDFRINKHGSEGPVGCFCPLHLAAYKAKTGRAWTPDEIINKALTGPPNPLRDQWFSTLSDSLEGLAKAVADAVHRVNPDTRVGLCTAMTLWSSEGVDMKRLLTVLAGKNRPFIRLIGAPYWSKEPMHTGWVVEYHRLQKNFLKGFDAEILCEGDTYPHSRFFCAAESLNAFEQGLVASGFRDMLLYPVLYGQTPGREKAFTARITQSRKNATAIAEFFPADAQDWGAEYVHLPNAARFQEIPSSMPLGQLGWPDEPVALRIMARLGLPLGYGGKGPVVLAGWGAAGLSDKELDTLLSRGALLDACAAQWLAARGFDVGFETCEPATVPFNEHFSDPEFSGAYHDDRVLLLTGGADVYFRFQLKPDAKPVSRFALENGQGNFPSAFAYENKKGQRVFTACFDLFAGRNGTQLLYSYPRQAQWTRALEWTGRDALPLTLPGEADVRVACRLTTDGRLCAAIQNLRLDPLVNPVLRFHPSFNLNGDVLVLLPEAEKPVRLTLQEVAPVDGHIEARLPGTIPAMGFTGISVARR